MTQPKISFAASTAKGQRQSQEDRYSIVTDLLGGDCYYFAIFDGHGGEDAAEYAKNNLHLEVERLLEVKANHPDALKSAFCKIDDQIHVETDSGTTATVLLLRNLKVIIANVGDSSAAYKKSLKQIRVLTKEHRLTNFVELDRYRTSSWFKEKSRAISQGKIKGFKLISVSRSLGDSFFDDAISPIPDVMMLEVEKGDLLILATDGLWNVVSVDQLESELLKKPIIEAHELSNFLVDLALKKGSKDNITVLTVIIQ